MAWLGWKPELTSCTGVTILQAVLDQRESISVPVETCQAWYHASPGPGMRSARPAPVQRPGAGQVHVRQDKDGMFCGFRLKAVLMRCADVVLMPARVLAATKVRRQPRALRGDAAGAAAGDVQAGGGECGQC